MALSPMMRQYMQRKQEYSDCILFFRLGDFYEMFFDDAKLASRELEITLTSRDCGQEERAPMCGVPYHSSSGYIARLIERGYKVAICEQMEDPALTKGLVERDVVRVITPGTLIEPDMLDEKQNNHILSVYVQGDTAGLAWADISTGEMAISYIEQGAKDALPAEIARIQPREMIANPACALLAPSLSVPCPISQRPEEEFSLPKAREAIKRQLRGKASAEALDSLPFAAQAAGALILYLVNTQKRDLAHINSIGLYSGGRHLLLDASARRNLELTQTIRERTKRGSLLWLLDETATAMGARQLRAWIEQPLAELSAIEGRLCAVEALFSDAPLCEALRESLRGVYDIERLLGRLSYGTITARECLALLQSLEKAPAAQALIAHLNSPMLYDIAAELDPPEDVIALLRSAIAPEPPIKMGEGGIIREGYSPELDTLRDAAANGRQWLLDLEAREREQTGIKSLKVGYNRVFGYYIEITRAYVDQAPYRYRRKQTLANGERYITDELKQLEETLLGAQEQALRLEAQLFQQVRDTLLESLLTMQAVASALKRLDALVSLATVAYTRDYVRPELHQGYALSIEQGRHPVVERMSDELFVPNDCHIDEQSRMLVITGPNMAGKSTYMRQVALIALLAHIGSFVPAKSARIPVLDSIYTRVGASDDLAAGQSTFMVEMREMSAILAGATDRSLLILDEIGRGTSTFDGLSIAWAAVEHIADPQRLGAKTLFATHYHELTELEGALSGVVNYFVDCKELGEDIVFLRTIRRGGADKSYGVHVAALAGLPKPLIARAREIMARLEVNDVSRQSISRNILDEPVGGQGQVGLLEYPAIELAKEIAGYDVNAMTPVEALNVLYTLREKAKRI